MRKSRKGPFVGLAVLCEKVLTEPDGVTSLIRIIDTVNVQIQPGVSKESVRPTIPLCVVVMFKSGAVRSKANVRIVLNDLAGNKIQEISKPLKFGGGERGVRLVANVSWGFPDEGLYWTDVYVDDDLMTRIPVRVNYRQLEVQTASA